MNTCKRFCRAAVVIDGKLFSVDAKTKERVPCPLGMSCFPKSEEKAHNVIRSNGRHTICNYNKWKYDEVT